MPKIIKPPKQSVTAKSPKLKTVSLVSKKNSVPSQAASNSSGGAVNTVNINCPQSERNAVQLTEDRLHHLVRRLEDALRDPTIDTLRLEQYIGTPLSEARSLLTAVGKFQMPYRRTLSVDRLVA